MSRFKQIKYPKDNPELDTIYKEAIEVGWVSSEDDVPMNAITSQSTRPDILTATWELAKGIVLQGQIPPTVKQMIGMTIAIQNNCRYCTIAHAGALEAMGVPSEVIKSCATDPNLANVPPPQRAIIQFALKTARDPQSITNDDFQTLRDFSLSDGEIMEVIMMAAYGNFLNTWTDVSAIPVDWDDEQ